MEDTIMYYITFFFKIMVEFLTIIILSLKTVNEVSISG